MRLIGNESRWVFMEAKWAETFGGIPCPGRHAELEDTADIDGYACGYCKAAL